MKYPQTIGAILAGGLARRMGGGDKGLRLLAGRPVLRWVLERLRPQVTELVLNANGDPARFGVFGLPVVADGVPGHPGPLAGVLAALDWAAERGGTAWVVTVPGDVPFLPDDLVGRLHAAGATLVTAASAGRAHPVVGLWPVALRGHLRRALVEKDVRRVEAFVERYERAVVEWEGGAVDPFFNVNTPADLAEAERRAHAL